MKNVRGAMNYATTNESFANDDQSFRNGITYYQEKFMANQSLPTIPRRRLGVELN